MTDGIRIEGEIATDKTEAAMNVENQVTYQTICTLLNKRLRENESSGRNNAQKSGKDKSSTT